MPSRLPIQDIFAGLVTSIGTAIRYWFHYTLVAFAWLGVVPLTACRIYKCLFTGSVSSLLTLPLDMLSTENLLADCLQGCFVVTCTLCAFISLVWLREQIVHGGAPIWLEHAAPPFNAAGHHQNEAPVGGNGAENAAADQPAHPAGENAVLGENPDAQDGQAEEEEEDNEEEDDAGVEDAADANNGAQDDMNWNALEWDRAAEELTWERMLGLDGSLVFLEHVFWVVSLNTLFILVFAFCPYHIGHFSLVGLGFEEHVQASHFEGLITTIVGYILLAITLIICHVSFNDSAWRYKTIHTKEFSLITFINSESVWMCKAINTRVLTSNRAAFPYASIKMLQALATLVKFHRSRRLLGVCYIVVKVSLLVVVEIGVFPLICGWWLDICSLEMFDATLKDRELSFQSAPGTTMFLHWLVGMVYVFYFASFILLLREVLRPGVLWFLRNLNDPDFNPVQEMIHLPIYRHLRRFILSVIVFGSIVLLMLWLPIRIIKSLLPNFLPYNVMLYRDLHSYLLGDQEENENSANQQANNNQPARNNNAVPAGEGLHAAHQAILQQGGPVGFQPYRRPFNFPLRIFLLIVFMCITLLIASLICLTLPVFAGRWLMSFWTGTAKIHELYTAACGLYVCWLTIRAVTVLVAWMPQGRRVIFQKVKEWSLMIMKTLIVAVLLAGVVPLLLGLLFELVIVAPLRVPLDQTPLFYPWQDWALGVLHAKIIAAITLMGPQWWLKTVIEQVYANGIRNIDLHYIIRKLAAPVISVLLLSLCVPYVIASGVVPLLGVTAEMQNLVHRRIYPFLLMVVVLMGILSFQVRQFKRLYEHIKNDKYLVGQRLVNYERKSGKQGPSTPPPQSYFSALSRGDPLPVKDRIEMPVATQKTDTGLTQGLLKVLHKQCSHKQYVELKDLEKKWKNLCLPIEKFRAILELDPCDEKIEWIKFLALGCSSLGGSLKAAMKNVCEILTEDPEGGPARIPFDTFSYIYQYLSGLDPDHPPGERELFLATLREKSESRKNNMIGLSDFYLGKKT
ncbi:E3 ubiquitin-protein ligase [Cricetulus griseus]|nr:E3 ubiquitin-protein ligase [Cricetulus griseus]